MWTFSQNEFKATDIALNGNRFLLGNGYMGYRGTMEEFGKEEQVACMINGLYDKVEGKWREPVNAPNGLFTVISCNGEELSVLNSTVCSHEQHLDIQHGVHQRKTVFEHQKRQITVESERFPGRDNVHLVCMKYQISVDTAMTLSINTGIDGDVWDINGPHLKDLAFTEENGYITAKVLSQELGHDLIVCEAIEFEGDISDLKVNELKAVRTIEIDAVPGKNYVFYKYVSVFTSLDTKNKDIAIQAKECCNTALQKGYHQLYEEHCYSWEKTWENCDTIIEGDEEAQFAIRYSIYHLLILATRHSSQVSIPARGLSGQVYKGAVFWDTEMFMLPFFTLTDTTVARNLIEYRYQTLDGARRKAQEYGFKGAFYAWESQETGNDACTHFNVPDVFTGRPMRTYFRDKQIHVSSAIVYGIQKYLYQTSDESILYDGAAEIIFECARFFYSYTYFKKDKDRFEMLDVTGPDEYHERVNNNAYTNKMVELTLKIALETARLLKEKDPEFYAELDNKIQFNAELNDWQDMLEKLYVPQPDKKTDIIEQFDGFLKLEDVSLDTLKSRLLDPHEYLGGGNGLATSTQILKQADVILMLNLFKDEYPLETIKTNWKYYEPRTEHGSSLSACAYAMTAANIGMPDWAYNYFMKTATVDLTGKSKQFLGDLYIGGTHPAANGGAWMSLVFGFAGLCITNSGVILNPHLPEKWTRINFKFELLRQTFHIHITKSEISISAAEENNLKQIFLHENNEYIIEPGETVTIKLG